MRSLAAIEQRLDALAVLPALGPEVAAELLALGEDVLEHWVAATCRELVYHYNLVNLEPRHPDTVQRLRMMTLVANHLFLFVAGKLQVRGLGDFCCASRPLREAAPPDPA